jgi:hypothetical protein
VFGFLKRWCGRLWSRDQSPEWFAYHDGHRRRTRRTFELLESLKTAEPDVFSLLADLAIWQHESKSAGEMNTPSFSSGACAFVRIVAAVRLAFGLVPSEAGGADGAAVFVMLDRFTIAVRRAAEMRAANAKQEGNGG